MRIAFLCTAALLFTAACSEGTTAEDVPAELGAEPSATEQHMGRGDRRCRVNHWVVKDERSPFIPDHDVDLIDALVPHHQMALEMADHEVMHGTDAEVKAMAAQMKEDQAREIEQLLRMREELTGCSNVPPIPDRHMERDMMMLMQASGLEVDILFLDHMIPHHAGAVQFTHNALPNLKREDLKEMAHDVIDTQSEEIGEMHAKKHELAPAR